MSDGNGPNERRRRWLAAAWPAIAIGSLGIAVDTWLSSGSGSALGPVIAVTPDEVTTSEFIGYVFHPTVSGRGEAVGANEVEVETAAWALLDVPGPEPVTDSIGFAVAADGCHAVNLAQGDGFVDVVLLNRCDGSQRVLTTMNRSPNGNNDVAISADGGAVAFVRADGEFSGFVETLVHIDARTLQETPFLLPADYFDWNAELGLDISDDGGLVVVTVVGERFPAFIESADVPQVIPEPLLDIALWDVRSGAVTIVSDPAGNVPGFNAFPSISGDGRFISFASTRDDSSNLASASAVFVVPTAGGAPVRVSPAGQGAYYSALNRDGTQAVYGVTAGQCGVELRDLYEVEAYCATTRIDVVFSPVPGLGSRRSTETISLNTANVPASGMHIEPDISSNGRWVTWVSDNGIDLVGTGDLSRFKGLRHAFVRQRDAALSVVPNPLDFGTLGSGGSQTLTATVTNTGRTSVAIDAITPSGAQFSVVPGGSCVIGLLMAPGTACTVNVRFTAPNATNTFTGTLFVGETGHSPTSVTPRLVGRSTSATTTTAAPGVTTVPPTTVVTGQNPTVTTSTTVPGRVLLSVSPVPVDFGEVAVGIGSAIRAVTVTNVGTAGEVLTTSLEGDHAGDFFVPNNGCDGVTLAPGASCTVEVIMIAGAGGNRSARLKVSIPGGGFEETVLQGVGRFSPELIASPSAVTLEGFTTIVGQGFPAGGSFVVVLGSSGVTIPVVADELGRFRVPFSVRRQLPLGNHVLSVAATDAFALVQAQLVVGLPTFTPQGPGGAAFGDALIVARG